MDKKNYFNVVFRNAIGKYVYFSNTKIEAGDLVMGIFRKEEKIGLVIEVLEDCDVDFEIFEAKLVIKKAIKLSQIILLVKVADYFFSSYGKVAGLFVPPVLWKKVVKAKREILLKLNNKKIHEIKLTKTQKETIDRFKEYQAEQTSDIILKEFLEDEAISKSRIDLLIKKEIFCLNAGKIINPNKVKDYTHEDKKKLTDEQKFAVNKISKGDKKKFILFGITGSGKTEIYLNIAKKNKKLGKNTIIIVPEIALTKNLVDYFSKSFENRVALVHSKLSDGQRVQEYFRIKNGEVDLVLGSRIAIFSPIDNLACVIIDEEHEWTYKNDKDPRYDTKKVAEFLAEGSGSKLIFGSATPSLENFYRGKIGEFEILTLKKRAIKETSLLETKMPRIEIIDMKKERENQNFEILSKKLHNEIKKTLENKKSVILFLNRRGIFSTLICKDCGKAKQCPNCDVSLVLHKAKNGKSKFLCHYCGNMQNVKNTCEHCDSKNIRYLSIGTQNLEREIKNLFPNKRIMRIDSDSTSRKNEFHRKLEILKRGDCDIFIGTQILAKGHDVKNIGLVGVVLADVGLHIPDFRSSERVFSTLMQVSGRTGRGKERGKVIIQSYSTNANAIKFIKNHDYESFFAKEIMNRKSDFFPPFSEIIKFLFVDKNKKKVFLLAKNFYENISKFIKENNFNSETFFAPAMIPKIHNKFHFNVFIKGKDIEKIMENIDVPRYIKIDRNPNYMG